MNEVALLGSGAASVATYTLLFGGVAFGAIVPVLPTGAMVSVAAAAAMFSDTPLNVLIVLILGSAAALLGDIVLFALCSTGRGRLQRWVRRRVDPDRLEHTRQRLAEHGVRVLLVSRLTPAGRIPVMVASILLGLSWRWFLAGDAVAVLAWAVTYAAIGILGGSLFDQAWQGIALAIGLVLVLSVATSVVGRLADRRRLSA